MTGHIHRRNIRFKNEIAVADKSKILGVAIDSSSNFHRVIIFNFLGKIMGRPFSVDVRRKGFETLVGKIDRAKQRISAERVYIALESSGHYSENLFNHLREHYKNVIHIPALAVANNRKQKSLAGLKTDDIDCGSIGDLLIRGEFHKSKQEPEVYYRLRTLTCWRERKMSMLVALKNQITSRLQYIFPGLNSEFGDSKKVAAELTRTQLYGGILNHPMTSQEYLQMTDEDLCSKFELKGQPHSKIMIRRFKEALKKLLLPDVSLAKAHIDLLKKDVELLNSVESEINQGEEEIVQLGKQTSAKYLMGQISGVSDLNAAMYVGLIGDASKYKSARQIFAKSGLAPKLRQSGDTNPRLGMTRAGNVPLRAMLFKMARQVVNHEPAFNSYYNRMKLEKQRYWKKNYVAISRKLNNVLYALIRDKSKFRRVPAAGSPTVSEG